MSLRKARHLSPLPASGGDEPVMDSAKVGRWIVTFGPALGLVLSTANLASPEQTATALDLLVTAVAAVATVVNFVVPIIRARRVREEVVPAGNVLAYREAGGHVVAGPAATAPAGTFVSVAPAAKAEAFEEG